MRTVLENSPAAEAKERFLSEVKRLKEEELKADSDGKSKPSIRNDRRVILKYFVCTFQRRRINFKQRPCG